MKRSSKVLLGIAGSVAAFISGLNVDAYRREKATIINLAINNDWSVVENYICEERKHYPYPFEQLSIGARGLAHTKYLQGKYDRIIKDYRLK